MDCIVEANTVRLPSAALYTPPQWYRKGEAGLMANTLLVSER